MKYWKVLVLLLLSSHILSQSSTRHNYSSQLLYNDTLINKISGIQSYNLNYYMLFGKVKSLFTKTTFAKGKKVTYSRKYYYNINKRIERIVVFGENIDDIELDKKYFRFGEYLGPRIVKEGFSKSGKIKFYSEIHHNKNLIIVREMIESQLKTLDSIYYIDDYKPIFIKKYSASNDLLESRKIEYDDERIVLSVRKKSNGYLEGKGLVYDEKNRIKNSIRIKNLKLNPFYFELGDTIKVINWEPSGFTYYNSIWNDTIVFNSKLSSVIINKRAGTVIEITLSKNLKPLLKKTTFASGAPPMLNEYHYNENGDLKLDIKSRINSKYNTKPSNYYYKYEYDKRNNWIVRREFNENEMVKKVERFIEYHN